MTGVLAAGVRVTRRSPGLARATLTSVISCVAQGMLMACIPLLGERVLGGAGRGALLLSCAAVSALVANAVLARFPRSLAPDTVIWVGALIQAAASALAATGRPAVLVVAAFVVGLGEGPQLTALFAVRHREAPEHLRSQIFTTGASLKITGFALGWQPPHRWPPGPCQLLLQWQQVWRSSPHWPSSRSRWPPPALPGIFRGRMGQHGRRGRGRAPTRLAHATDGLIAVASEGSPVLSE
ncbi:hypothetical protein NKH18_13905 [Streptomyces sp. M10(2022)]